MVAPGEPAAEVGVGVGIELPLGPDAVMALSKPFGDGQDAGVEIVAVEAEAEGTAAPAGAEVGAVFQEARGGAVGAAELVDVREAGGEAAFVALEIQQAAVELPGAAEAVGPRVVDGAVPIERAAVGAVDGARIDGDDAADGMRVAGFERFAEDAVGENGFEVDERLFAEEDEFVGFAGVDKIQGGAEPVGFVGALVEEADRLRDGRFRGQAGVRDLGAEGVVVLAADGIGDEGGVDAETGRGGGGQREAGPAEPRAGTRWRSARRTRRPWGDARGGGPGAVRLGARRALRRGGRTFWPGRGRSRRRR